MTCALSRRPFPFGRPIRSGWMPAMSCASTAWPAPSPASLTRRAGNDNCPSVGFGLTEVTSDEPENGPGDGDTAPDIVDAALGTPDFEFSLRDEQAGGGDGRTFTATYTTGDGSGNQAAASATVDVPKSQGSQ